MKTNKIDRVVKSGRQRKSPVGARRLSLPNDGRAVAPAPKRSRSRLRIQSVLVPIDFSEESEKALAYAEEFAKQFESKLTVVHVIEPMVVPDFARTLPLAMENDKLIAECKRNLERFLAHLKIRPELVEKVLIRQGRAFNEIADAARTLKVDLVIIATHGRTGLKHAMLGSTAERVVRHAPCPVLVIRELERELV